MWPSDVLCESVNLMLCELQAVVPVLMTPLLGSGKRFTDFVESGHDSTCPQ
jgi:hypothetical protein